MRRLITCLAFCLSFSGAAANPNLASRWRLSQWQRRVWQIEDGLPHNYVTAISRDSERYLLVGTQTGIARFDGMRFRHFGAIGDLWIYSLLRTSDGALWVGTYKQGLYRIKDSHTERWGVSKGFTDASVFSLLEDKQHRVWFASEAGLWLIGQNRAHCITRGYGTNGYTWQPVTIDNSGSIWFAAQNGLFHYTAGTARAIPVNGVSGAPVTVYFRNPDQRLYLGTTNGLYTLNCEDNRCEATAVHGVSGPVVGIRSVTDGSLWVATWGRGLYRVIDGRVEQLSTREGLADDFVRTITEDSEHNIWVGTRGGGLTRFRATVLKPVGMPEGLGGNCASVAVGDGHGGVWLGTWRSGLFHWRAGALEAQPLPEPSLHILITSLAVDAFHRLWIGSMSNLWVLSHFGAKAEEVRLPAPADSISQLLVDRKHELWVAKEGQGILLFPSGDPRTSRPLHLLSGQTVTALYENAAGAVWIGAEQGLWRASANSGRDLQEQDLQEIDPSIRQVTTLHEDLKGRIWVASSGGRVVVYSGLLSQPFRYANLPAPDIYSILEDNRDGMWFSTGRGLARGNMHDIENSLASPRSVVNLTAYGVAEGMRTIECRCAKRPQSWKMSDGTIWVPTAKGFVQIDQSRSEPLKPPKPVIEQIALDGRTMTVNKLVKIPPGRHELEARFTAIRLGAAEGVRFRYRMAGLEPDWVWAGSVRVARYGQLPPGHFQLLLSARDASGEWSDAISVPIEQQPHIYQTWWFRGVLLASVLGLTVLAYRLRLRILHARYSAVIGERNRIAREFHDTLLAGLSAVSWQIDAALASCAGLPAEPNLRSARGMLRYCRDEARRAVGDLRDEPEPEPPLPVAIENAVLQITAGTAVQAIFEIDRNSAEVQPELSLELIRVCQEAVSNAMRHAQASQVTVRLRCEDGDIRLSIKDNGTGADPNRLQAPPTGHFGILGMRERARRLGGRLLITSDAGGTLVEAIVPV